MTGKASAYQIHSGKAVDLFDYIKSHSVTETYEELGLEHPGYNRALHFGDWINDDPQNDCYDVRNEVLIRDADQKKPITFRSDDHCRVSKATWNDPYTGNVYKLASAIQIDHVVPLKHTYLTGAYAWRASKRCTYANFIADDFHLLAVSGHENMSKGDRSPDGYMPPNKSFQCEYIADWMKVKAIWELKSTLAEVAAIEKVIEDRGCSPASLTMNTDELAKLRRKTAEPPQKCIEFEDLVRFE
jgi:hypothetical protein